ncbi:MAG: hypothetical protein U9P00_00065, partial [Pseudomonadota bacterium]|nr:hypothetical protein [Pseudomonadota bacterium]
MKYSLLFVLFKPIASPDRHNPFRMVDERIPVSLVDVFRDAESTQPLPDIGPLLRDKLTVLGKQR